MFRSFLAKSVSLLLVLAFCLPFSSCKGKEKSDGMTTGDESEITTGDELDFVSLDNVAYGDDEKQKFDIVMPKKNGGGAVIVMIHGGAWTDGGKDEFGNMMYDFYEAGITFASINYRFASDDVSMDEILDDVTAALKKIKETAKDNGIELKNAMLGGISAGGQTALLYAYSKRDASPIDVKCCLGMSAVSDMTDESLWFGNSLDSLMTSRKMADIAADLCKFEFDKTNFENAIPYLKAISPLNYANNAVPTILAHGQADDIIKYDIAVRMYNALTENGIECDFVDFPHSGHSLESDDVSKINLNRLISEYCDKYLK